MLEAHKTQPAKHAERPAIRRRTPGSTSQNINETVNFDGGAGAVICLVLCNVIFSILTLGLYSFRGKARLRRHFLGQTAFLGNRLKYSGSGARLFAGYAAAILALGGLTAAYVLAWKIPAIFGSHPLEHPEAIIGVSFLYLTGMLYVFHFAAFRASRHFLSQVTWRGLNTTQTGSAFGYANWAAPYSLLVLLTLGLAYPFMRDRIQTYKINHTRCGKERLHYHGAAEPLFRFWLLPWSIGVALTVSILLAMETQVQSLADTNWLADTNLPLHAWNTFVGEETWLVLSGFILFSLAMHWYRSVEALHFADNTTFARLRFISRLTHADFLIAWVNSVVLVAILGAISVAAFLAIGSAMVAFSAGGPAVGYALAALILSTLAVIALLLGSVRWLILHNLLAGASRNGLAIKGRVALDRLVAKQPTTTTRERAPKPTRTRTPTPMPAPTQTRTRIEPTLDMNPAPLADDEDEPYVMVNNSL